MTHCCLLNTRKRIYITLLHLVFLLLKWDHLSKPSKDFLGDILFFSKAEGQSATYLKERAIKIEDWEVTIDGYLWSMPELATRWVQFSNQYLPVRGKLTDKSIVREFDSCLF